MIRKPIIAIDFSTTGKGGGPYTSNERLFESSLNKKYEFKKIIYRTEMGRFISVKRIIDLAIQLKYVKPDIVHFSGLGLMGFHIAVACKLANLDKTILTIHGFSADALDISNLKRFVLAFIIEPLTIGLVKYFYGVSKFVTDRKWLRLFKKKNLGYIYNIPYNQNFCKNNISIRKELNISKNNVVGVSVGRITKDKGYHILTKSLKSFLINNKNAIFIIVGSGSYLDEMKNELRELKSLNKIFFLGYRSDVKEILCECDYFVLPTLHETLSIALLEASEAKLPLIGSNTGGVPEIIIPNENGLLVEPGNYKELELSMFALHVDKDLRLKLGNKSKEILSQKFNIQNILNDIDAVYKKLLRSSDE
jgi:glycosyltransferase involved in cell wall biosynthesis